MSDRLNGHLAMFTYVLFISTSYGLATWLADYLAPLVTVFMRFFLATATFLFIFLQMERRLPTLPGASAWWRITVMSLPLTIFFVAMFFAAEVHSPVLLASIFTLVPITSAALAAILGNGPTGHTWLALTVGSLAALYLVLSGGDGSTSLSGQLDWTLTLYLISCLLMAANPLLIPKLGQGLPVVWRTFWMLALASAMTLLLIAVLPAEMSQISVPQWNWQLIMVLIWIGVGTTAATSFLYQFGAMKLTTAEVGSWNFSLPVVVLIETSLVFNHWPTTDRIMAASLACVAILLVVRQTRRQAEFNLTLAKSS